MTHRANQLVNDFSKDLAQRIADELYNATKSCLTCQYFNEQRELCGRYPERGRPPARVVAFGCPEYENQPPF